MEGRIVERVELHDLARADADRIVAAALPGPVHTRTTEDLWRLSRGNLLFLRELVEGGRAEGRLRPQHGVWRWDGPVQPTRRLTEIVLDQLSGLCDEERAALEILAAGEPLGIADLVRLSDRDAVTGLERAGLIEARPRYRARSRTGRAWPSRGR